MLCLIEFLVLVQHLVCYDISEQCKFQYFSQITVIRHTNLYFIRATRTEITTMADILSTVQLKGLKDHKYSSQGSTLLDPLMQKLWRWLVEQMPLWLAPNAITLVGLMCNVFTTHLLLMYSSDAKSGVCYAFDVAL